MKNLLCWSVLMLFFTIQQTFAQVAFTFLPEVNGRTLDGLFQVGVINNGAPMSQVTLQITVNAQPGGKIVTIKTKPFQLQSGVNRLPAGLIGTASIFFASNKQADIARQSGFFTEGDYEYCFELTEESGHATAPTAEQCFDYFLQPFSPLLLSAPADEEEICDKRPTFYWQPMLPAIPGMQYRLLLTTLKPGQAKVEALRYNMALINQQLIQMPMLFFPPAIPELNEGQEYVWQVTAYRNDMILANSEIWTFKVKCNDSTQHKVPESFRDIDDLVKGNFYVARGSLLFAVKNIYDKADLVYSISGITKPEQRIKKLPKLPIERGVNHITIDLSDSSGFVDGDYYLLTVKLPDGEVKQLRFLFKNETE